MKQGEAKRENGVLYRFFGHLKTILNHKRLVRRHCFAVGLYVQGIMHDWSKYHPAEFFKGVRYYTGKFSPNRLEKQEYGFSKAWMHHKGRNKHHFEYWVDTTSSNEPGPKRVRGVKMPYRYVAEMFCDRVAASKNYNKEAYTDADAWNYYLQSKDADILHPETRAQIEELLQMLKDKGEKATFAYLKEKIAIAKRQKV